MTTRFSITNDLINDFLISKRNTGWSDRMIQRAKRRLVIFYADFERKNKFSSENLSEWRTTLEERGLSKRTINEYISLVNQFISFVSVDEFPENNKRSLNLAGQEFGDLRVIEKTGRSNFSDRSIIWRCQCKCGNVVEIPATQLRKGCHTSCGCQKVKRLKEVNQYTEGTSLRMVFSDTVRRDNTSGCKGVYQKNGRWAARIQYKGKRYFLGVYDKLEDAVTARKEAEEKVREDARLLENAL